MARLHPDAAVVAILIGREPDLRYSVYRGYVDAVAATGALPVVLPAVPYPAALERALDIVRDADALLLTGGGDVDPAQYGEVAAPEVYDVDAVRDAFEIDAFQVARTAGIRVLGICRGVQIMAVASGGRLHQHLPAAGFEAHHWELDRQREPVHEVIVEPGSIAEHALGGSVKVNSIHHQAVAEPGRDLRATAWSDDGVIEAIEGDGALGIQWHPERMFDGDARHLAPFRWLTGAS